MTKKKGLILFLAVITGVIILSFIQFSPTINSDNEVTIFENAKFLNGEISIENSMHVFFSYTANEKVLGIDTKQVLNKLNLSSLADDQWVTILITSPEEQSRYEHIFDTKFPSADYSDEYLLISLERRLNEVNGLFVNTSEKSEPTLYFDKLSSTSKKTEGKVYCYTITKKEQYYPIEYICENIWVGEMLENSADSAEWDYAVLPSVYKQYPNRLYSVETLSVNNQNTEVPSSVYLYSNYEHRQMYRVPTYYVCQYRVDSKFSDAFLEENNIVDITNRMISVTITNENQKNNIESLLHIKLPELNYGTSSLYLTFGYETVYYNRFDYRSTNGMTFNGLEEQDSLMLSNHCIGTFYENTIFCYLIEKSETQKVYVSDEIN